MNEKFLNFMQKFSNAHLAVAVSGGVDSVCLLHWLAGLGLNITALHVNHHLRPSAGIEAEYVADICAKLNVPCRIFDWTSDKPDSGLEAAARTARYRFMTEVAELVGEFRQLLAVFVALVLVVVALLT